MAQIIPRFQAFDSTGAPLSGGKLDTKVAGTSTNKTTYSDPGLTTPNANPVVLDSRGEAAIFGSGTYKLILKTSADVTIWTQDDVEVASATMIVDADGDTKVQCEESADEDIIRFDAGGTEQVTISSAGLNVDTINEKTADGGVTIDGVLIRDGILINGLPGLHLRPNFSYKDADEIYIDSFLIHHSGTTQQNVYCNSQLTFKFGSAGSNADSDNLAANKFFYLFIDDSAVVILDANLLTVAELIAKNEDNVTVTWNAAKHGFYETTATNDKCIGAFLTDGSSNILEFYHDDNLFMPADGITELSASAGIDTTWTDIDLASSMPSFSTKALLSFTLTYVDATAIAYWRTNGQAGTAGHEISAVSAGVTSEKNTAIVITDSSQIIEVKLSAASDDTIGALLQGWFFPRGM